MDNKFRNFKRGLTPDPTNKFQRFIQNSDRAESEWGRRERRKGTLDTDTLAEAEKLFAVQLPAGEELPSARIPVEISEDFPEISSFSDIELHSRLLANIEKMQYKTPTPIQKYGIPVSVLRRDLMACAQTGSGKTAAFLIPIIAKMLSDGPPPFSGCKLASPVTLVLAPTRELSIQIYEEALKFTYRTGMRVVVVYGGADPKIQSRELFKGADILVATPGRLLDFLTRNRIELARVRYLVLDEADRMLDMGFEQQIRNVLRHIPENDRETVMYSATFPRDIQTLAAEFLKKYVFLSVGRVGSTAESIKQNLEFVEESAKENRLLELVRGLKGLVLVFVEMKRTADFVRDMLNSHGISCTCIHGNRTQPERERALKDFKDKTKPILVATDVASRGLDIPDVSYVINYDTPSNIDDYVHRIGRTGRIGKSGMAYSFVNDKNKPIIRDLKKLLMESKQTVPEWLEMMNREQALAVKRNKERRFKSIHW